MRRGIAAVAALLMSGLAVANAPDATAAVQKHVDIEWVTVGDPGNRPDTEVMVADRTTGYGGVDYVYRISKYDVTNTEYAAFLNAVASKSDPHVLFFPCMDKRKCYRVGSGIAREGKAGAYTYRVQKGRERRPVNYVNLYMAMRFANWLHNGQGKGSTETGAYTLKGNVPLASTNMLMVRRNPGAKVFVPSEDEWYKAAYYDPQIKGYWDFPGRSNTPMRCEMPSAKPNAANCGLITARVNPNNPGLPSASAWFFADVTDVGAYTGSPGPWGTFDQGGNLFQWTEELTVDLITQYHAGSHAPRTLDRIFNITGNPFETGGIGFCGVVRGTDFGDGGEFNHANGRTCDIAADPFETYGIRLAARP